jgi:hypothetical protein
VFSSREIINTKHALQSLSSTPALNRTTSISPPVANQLQHKSSTIGLNTPSSASSLSFSSGNQTTSINAIKRSFTLYRQSTSELSEDSSIAGSPSPGNDLSPRIFSPIRGPIGVRPRGAIRVSIDSNEESEVAVKDDVMDTSEQQVTGIYSINYQ